MLDNSQQVGYNSTQLNDAYADVAGVDASTHIVKLDEQKPVNDTECKHETLIPDPEDTIGDAIYHGCANHKCGIGFYIKSST